MNLSPGTTVSLTIDDLAFGGEGVGRVDDFVVFVSFVLVGEVVEAEITEVKKNFARARLVRVIQPASERVEPPCRYFAACGGCQYQHIAYKTQLRIKHEQIADLFQRIGGVRAGVVAPVIPCPQPYGYRNRIMIRSQWNKPAQKLNIGFIRWDGGLVEDIEECKIAEPALNAQLKHVRAHPPPKGGIKVVLRIPPEGWDVPPDSFFQNNFFLLPKLVEAVRECLRGVGVQASACSGGGLRDPKEQAEACTPTARHLVDLYCGVGFFGIELADAVESFVGVEYDQRAIKAAQRNAAARGRTNGEFMAATVEEALPQLLKRFSPQTTTVLLDPPRKGCWPPTLQLLRRERPAQIIYVSCHPATMARDLNILCRNGVFDVVRVLPLDMFPQTQHVECVADLRAVENTPASPG
ncbi:MAG TPA: class I SAM-dependent RNA methyltransferase [Verrucomicrobiae bacterium]|nr:class I SAM-dependent RNA methyltransferase [Verrucomicrobiae bacterium]